MKATINKPDIIWNETMKPAYRLVAPLNKDNIGVFKETERKLRHSEMRLRQAQAIAHIGSWELDLLTGIAEWSEEACRIYGLDPGDNIQSYQSWLSFIHPDDMEYVLQAGKVDMEITTTFSFEHRIVRWDGSIRYIFSKGQYEFNEAGQPIYLHGTSYDITETKQTEEALKLSRANFQLILDLIPLGIFSKDETGRFTYVNKSFAGLYGKTPTEMVENHVCDTIPVKQEAAEFLNQDMQVLTECATKIIPEQTFTDNNGNNRLFHTVKVPYISGITGKTMVLGIATDITAQKQAESEHEKIIGDIIQRNKNLEKFSYIVSHNLRAPVANFMGLANLLQLPELTNEDKDDLIGKLNITSDKLNDVVKDLNDILQIDRKENKEKEWVQFSDKLAKAAFSFRSIIKKEGIKIVSDFSEVEKLFTIKNYLYSIFFNLISNSIKFRKPGEPLIIEIATRKRGNEIQLILKDNGTGMDLENKGNQVFGLYKRFHPHIDGKGMGLFMVKTQVESLGGTITVNSEVNKGTEFKIDFKIQ